MVEAGAVREPGRLLWRRRCRGRGETRLSRRTRQGGRERLSCVWAKTAQVRAVRIADSKAAASGVVGRARPLLNGLGDGDSGGRAGGGGGGGEKQAWSVNAGDNTGGKRHVSKRLSDGVKEMETERRRCWR